MSLLSRPPKFWGSGGPLGSYFGISLAVMHYSKSPEDKNMFEPSWAMLGGRALNKWDRGDMGLHSMGWLRFLVAQEGEGGIWEIGWT